MCYVRKIRGWCTDYRRERKREDRIFLNVDTDTTREFSTDVLMEDIRGSVHSKEEQNTLGYNTGEEEEIDLICYKK